MAFLRGMDDSDPTRSAPVDRGSGAHEEERRVARSRRMASGTLACAECDAPIALTGGASSPTDWVACPFCAHEAPLRDFLSLAAPTRPTHVDVYVYPRVRPGVR